MLWRISAIKGTSTYIRFILDDGSFVKGNGERLVNGFWVHKDTLRLIEGEKETPLTDTEMAELISAVNDFMATRPYVVEFE